MKKPSLALFTVSFLLILLVATFTTTINVIPMISVRPVKADIAKSAEIWGWLGNVSEPPGEYNLEWALCDYVYWMFPYADTDWLVENNYAFDTWTWPWPWCDYSTFVYYTLLYFQEFNIHTNTLWVGDFTNAYSPYYPYRMHWTCYGQPVPGGYPRDLVWDSMIAYCLQQYTSSTQHFTFIWTCSNAGYYWYWDGSQLHENTFVNNPNYNNRYGYFDPHGDAVGMPLAWTGTSILSSDGYRYPDYSSYCVIGFEGPSRSLIHEANGDTGANYGHWLYYFYAYATGQIGGTRHNIHDSLDYASNQIWDQDYDGCPLDTVWQTFQNGFNWNCTMRVLGDSLYAIPN